MATNKKVSGAENLKRKIHRQLEFKKAPMLYPRFKKKYQADDNNLNQSKLIVISSNNSQDTNIILPSTSTSSKCNKHDQLNVMDISDEIEDTK